MEDLLELKAFVNNKLEELETKSREIMYGDICLYKEVISSLDGREIFNAPINLIIARLESLNKAEGFNKRIISLEGDNLQQHQYHFIRNVNYTKEEISKLRLERESLLPDIQAHRFKLQRALDELILCIMNHDYISTEEQNAIISEQQRKIKYLL